VEHKLTDQREWGEMRKVQGQLTRGRGSKARAQWSLVTGRSPPARMVTGERSSPEEQRGAREQRGSQWPLARLGLEAVFLNALWAHQIVYSACPVHTGQRIVAVR
jgi:hypothetical protein